MGSGFSGSVVIQASRIAIRATRSSGMLAIALSMLVANACVDEHPPQRPALPNADRVEPPPAQMPYLAVKLPPSSERYHF